MDKPWFKFTANNWLSGSVQLLSDGEKGTYIDLMAMIWKEGGSLKVDKILSRKLRLDHATVCDRIDSYCELNILVCEDDVLSIKFLSDQLDSINEVSKKNSENAKKRWSKDKPAMRPNANKKRKEEKREEEIEKKKQKTFTPPAISEVSKFFDDNGYKKEAGEKAFNYYQDANWKDARGNQVKNWKQKMRGVWFKDENKKQESGYNPF